LPHFSEILHEEEAFFAEFWQREHISWFPNVVRALEKRTADPHAIECTETYTRDRMESLRVNTFSDTFAHKTFSHSID